MAAITTSIQHGSLESLDRAVRYEQEIEHIQVRKEQTKLSLFSDGISIFHICIKFWRVHNREKLLEIIINSLRLQETIMSPGWWTRGPQPLCFHNLKWFGRFFFFYGGSQGESASLCSSTIKEQTIQLINGQNILINISLAYVYKYLISTWRFSTAFFSFSFFLFWATCMTYWSSQASGQIRAVVAGLHHSHSNKGSKLHLWPTSQLVATPDPWPTVQDQGSNPYPQDTSQLHFYCTTMGTPQHH